MISLDHAATTKPHEQVTTSMQQDFEDHYYNPSAVYATDEDDAVRNARVAGADLLGASAQSVVFISGGHVHRGVTI